MLQRKKNIHQTRYTKHDTPWNGFTLLEVLAAVAILAIVLVSVYRLHMQTIDMTGASQFYTRAPLLAQQKLSEFEIAGIADAVSDEGDFGDALPAYRWQMSTEDLQPAILGDDGGVLKRIDIAVTFNDEELIYRLRTYRHVME